MSNAENVPPGGCGGVARAVRRVVAAPPAGVRVLVRDETELRELVAVLDGPADTPYAGGEFRVRVVLGRDFPASPPRAYFETRVFHPNVAERTGEVCVNTLRRDWRPELGLEHALLALRCLLIAPNAESALNAEAGALLQDRYEDYCARARMMTEIHARPQSLHPNGAEGNKPGSMEEGEPRAKQRRAAAALPPAKDKRRILKRL